MKIFAANLMGLLLAVAALTGCAVHKVRDVEPDVAPPAEFARLEAEADDYAGERWWEAFDDPRLEAVIDSALKVNHGLAQAVARLKQAEAAADIARAGRLPSLNLNGRASRGKQTSPFGSQDSENYSLSASASYEVDIWRKMASAHEAGRLEAEAGLRELQSMYLTLTANVADLYYTVAEQRTQLALTDQTIESFDNTLKLVMERYEQGLVGALDVYQARQNLAGARARRPQIEASLAAAEHQLSILLAGYPEPVEDAVVAELPETPAAFPAGLPSDLLARRPDVEASMLRLMAADARIARAVADRFPSFNLLGEYGRSRSEYGGSGQFPPQMINSSFWNLAANLLMPLFDGGRRGAEVDRRRAMYEELLHGYQQKVLTAFGEVEDALVRNSTTEERIARLTERTEAAGAALRLAVENYRQGLSDYLPVLTSQSSDYESRSQLVAARRQLISDRIGLARALGGNWMATEAEQRLSANAEEDDNDGK